MFPAAITALINDLLCGLFKKRMTGFGT
ncbi:hypothetical protein G9444_2558 [Rhodococcus erythropolis]|uniref:Uncharacterized protein n=1 Tax=Rhodococcus erythropolis TaxID=1833 RepID=A0A6G9CSH8_RHOER|nr:hypothetical protein G9444_2558 [Rhodococcus erythropolis]